MGIVRAGTGQVVARYSYDAWGKCTVTNAGGFSVGRDNPFRYRGYYHDAETGFYYLNSRYYNPEWGRFISADTSAVLTATPMALTDKNLFAYCDNNPIVRKDDGGQFWHFIAGGVIGGLIGGVSQVVSNVATGRNWSDGLGVAVATGAASGILAASGVGIVGSIAGNAAISMAGNATNQVIKNGGFKNFDVDDMLMDGVIGGLCGAIGGPGASSVKAGAGGAKQVTNLGAGTVRRTWNALIHDGVGAYFKEAGKAARYYMSSTKVVTKKLFTLKNGVLQTIPAVRNLLS